MGVWWCDDGHERVEWDADIDGKHCWFCRATGHSSRKTVPLVPFPRAWHSSNEPSPR